PSPSKSTPVDSLSPYTYDSYVLLINIEQMPHVQSVPFQDTGYSSISYSHEAPIPVIVIVAVVLLVLASLFVSSIWGARLSYVSGTLVAGTRSGMGRARRHIWLVGYLYPTGNGPSSSSSRSFNTTRDHWAAGHIDHSPPAAPPIALRRHDRLGVGSPGTDTNSSSGSLSPIPTSGLH
ncbi:hypothetical protein EIP91_009855, partial [Steccherinum ochraceum]